MDFEFLRRRKWDAQQALATLINELECKADYSGAAHCRALLRRMLSDDMNAALDAALPDAADGERSVASVMAGLRLSLELEAA